MSLHRSEGMYDMLLYDTNRVLRVSNNLHSLHRPSSCILEM